MGSFIDIENVGHAFGLIGVAKYLLGILISKTEISVTN